MNRAGMLSPDRVRELMLKFNCTLKPVTKTEVERAAHPRREPKTGPKKNRYLAGLAAARSA